MRDIVGRSWWREEGFRRGVSEQTVNSTEREVRKESVPDARKKKKEKRQKAR